MRTTNAIFRLPFVIAFLLQANLENVLSRERHYFDSVDDCCAGNVVELDSDGNIKSGKNLEKLFDGIANQQRKRIVLYIHGGRVTRERARKHSAKLTAVIRRTDSNAYPIFLNWEAGQGTSYFRHLAYERNGISYRESSIAPIAALGSPIVFFADLGRGVSRLPINTVLSVGKLLQNWDTFVGRNDHLFPVKGRFDERLQDFVEKSDGTNEKQMSKVYKEGFVYPTSPRDSMQLSVSMGRDARLHTVGFAAGYMITLPLQFLTEPILDTIGTPAWRNMVRRTRSMFHLQSNYISVIYRQEPGGKGGASVFFVET